jgi:predicted nucleic acid-binding protein
MSDRVEDISRYVFTSSDKLFLDTNIWFLINVPQKPGDSRVNTYSGAYRNMLTAQSAIYIDSTVVSEYLNLYVRYGYELSRHKQNLRDFRKSKEFLPVAQDAVTDAKLLLSRGIWLSNGLEQAVIYDLLDAFALGDSDFNDQIISTHCREHGLQLITDDGGSCYREQKVECSTLL